MSREEMLQRVRTALGRSAEHDPAGHFPRLAPPRLTPHELDSVAFLPLFSQRLTALGGRVVSVATAQEACGTVAEMLAGKTAVASNSRLLSACGITALPGVVSQ